jgi:hypothetical protein
MAIADRAFCSRCLNGSFSLTQFRAVLNGGVFPGPVIRGRKGDRFQLNLINELTDGTMLRSTSIVCPNIYCLNSYLLSTAALAWRLAARPVKLGRRNVLGLTMSCRCEPFVLV